MLPVICIDQKINLIIERLYLNPGILNKESDMRILKIIFPVFR